MKINDQQIDQLYVFTRKHYVEYYDVQTELVDHLANDIEKIWQESPHVTFEQARDASFKKFGVFGFMDVVDEKQKQLGKKYRRILFNYAKEWFKIPKIVLTLALFLGGFYFLKIPSSLLYFKIFICLLLIIIITRTVQLQRMLKRRKINNQKKWMFEEMIFKAASLGAPLLTVNMYNIFSSTLFVADDSISTFGITFISLLMTLLFIYSHITLYVIPSKVDQFLEEHYPEYKIA